MNKLKRWGLSSLSVLVLSVFFSCTGGGKSSQEVESQDSTQMENSPEVEVRASPKMTAEGKAGEVAIVINYGAPSVKGRTIWGGLEAYGKVWRTGANEATTIAFSDTVEVAGKQVPAGTYAVFTIPTEGEWTVILNSVANQWGAYDYDATKDVLRFTVQPSMDNELVEVLQFTVTPAAENTAEVSLMWEKMKLSFLVKSL